jgi:hypothetical protein
MMRRIILSSILALTFLLALVPFSKAEMAKEGTISGTVTYGGTHKVYPLDKENFAYTYENFGVRVSDSKTGPFHGMSTHNIGITYFENGVGRLRGYIFNVDKDGDKVIIELTEEGVKLGSNPVSGKGKIVGGTGKFKGIQGSYEYTRRSMKPAAKLTHQSISRGKGTWKIVEPSN